VVRSEEFSRVLKMEFEGGQAGKEMVEEISQDKEQG
jgi:hypothetical protein